MFEFKIAPKRVENLSDEVVNLARKIDVGLDGLIADRTKILSIRINPNLRAFEPFNEMLSDLSNAGWKTLIMGNKHEFDNAWLRIFC